MGKINNEGKEEPGATAAIKTMMNLFSPNLFLSPVANALQDMCFFSPHEQDSGMVHSFFQAKCITDPIPFLEIWFYFPSLYIIGYFWSCI